MPGQYRKRELINDVLVVTHLVDDSHQGWRADRYLCSLYHHYSRARIQRFIDEGRINLTSAQARRLKPSTRLQPGDRVHLSTKMSPAEEPEVDFSYQILFEDEHLLVVDKPGNLPVHPAGRYFFNSLLMTLRKDREAWMAAGPGRDLFLIHRLDKETSGALVVAKHREAAAAVWQEFSGRRAEKRYYAIVHGQCQQEAFDIDADIGTDRSSSVRLKMAAFPKGTGEFSALTRIRRVPHQATAPIDLLECKLETGRQHQIRVHLAHAGYPIVGDKLYGGDERVFLEHLGYRRPMGAVMAQNGKHRASGQIHMPKTRADYGMDRHALHSRYLRFYHALAKRWIEAESPLPCDMQTLLRAAPGHDAS